MLVSGEAAPGTSTALTVDSAAERLRGLLSAETEEQQPSDAPSEETETKETEVEETKETEEPEPEEPEEVDESEPVDPEAEVDEPEEPEETPPAPRTFKVKVDGQELEVTEDELTRGYSRTADYTRKTQQLAEEKRSFDSEKTAVTAERQRYATAIAKLDEIIEAQAQQEPDWDTLRQGDPAEFAAAWADWDRSKRQRDAVKAERARAEAQVNKDADEAFQRHIREEQDRLFVALPEWKDEKTRKTEQQEVLEYARNLGYTEEELNGLADHRAILALRDAVRGRKQATVKAKAEPIVRQKIEQTKVATPGPSDKAKPKVTQATKARQALAKTGSIKDAAALIRLADL